MNSRFSKCLIVLALSLAACSQRANDSPGSPLLEIPLSSYATPPSPLEIDAPRIEEPALIELNMLDELNGWGVTRAEIARTNDGGINWYNVTPPELKEIGLGVDTYVLDNDHVWVQQPVFEKFPNSGTLYRTADGGLTWTISTVPFSRGDLNFIDSEHGWMLADLGVGAGSNAVAVFQTSNGGASWAQTYTNDPNDAHAADSLPLGGIKTDLVPLDRNTAWVTGVVYTPGEAYLYRTDDGGQTWNKVLITLPPGAEDLEVSIDKDQMKFVSEADGFMALRMANETTQTAVYITQDAGNTWAVPTTPLIGAGESVFLSTQEAIIYNGEQFYVTHDGARTWIIVSPDTIFGEFFGGMEFVNPLSGWVITIDGANHSLYRTYDGGKTWSAILP